MTEEQILDVYKRHGAYLQGHFLLSSGLHSDTYLQTALVMQYPVIAESIIGELVKKVYDINFDTVVSPAIGGIRFGYEFARLLRKRAIFTERENNEMTLRRGFSIKPGEKVMIAEDVVTTGKSTMECVKVALDHGAEVVGIVCMIDRSGGEANFAYPFFPLVRIKVGTYDPSDCPLCKQGLPLVKPGSRKIV
ncbi:orotate phosphoribosyltransferase [Calditerrivibrio nitroreducens]|uniref:Orotate phosphoribosyltransferase n=1 Tax=Calditerrivibrio nitroreducens (strain DSM 19672 / NBRC 101217 / Yu37-1) TaxID=768670 RepID=E4THX0_CALNY|nr:orotate phosphoribosyltransferase [Calditerrivibrio nitroreducens]ADR18900.1 orotate phosphoribosyltransferase [Calditerrivibrio nitroreducens DSM 19672]